MCPGGTSRVNNRLDGCNDGIERIEIVQVELNVGVIAEEDDAHSRLQAVNLVSSRITLTCRQDA